MAVSYTLGEHGRDQAGQVFLVVYRSASAPARSNAPPRYPSHGDQRPHAVTDITTLSVTIRTPPLDDPAARAGKRRPHRRTSTRNGPQPPTRRQLITAIITSQPPRDWAGHELAVLLHVKPRHMLTQLGEWSRLGFFTPHRLRHLPAQHAAGQHMLDSRARPLTTRHCIASRSLRQPRPSGHFPGSWRLQEGRGRPATGTSTEGRELLCQHGARKLVQRACPTGCVSDVA